MAQEVDITNPATSAKGTQSVRMAFSELPLKASCSLNNLHRDMRPADSHGLKIPDRDSASLLPLDGHLVAHSLQLDLYNPLAPSNKHKPHKVESNPGPLSAAEKEKGAARIYGQNRHIQKSSTASLAEFLKTTGPGDLRESPVTVTARPLSPVGTKKKNAGGFLVRLGVGKSISTSKKEDVVEMATTSDNPSPPLAQPQFTAAGRKYYAIKVDYSFRDDSSISGCPLLAESPIDPNADTRSEMDFETIMAMKKHHRISSVLASDTSMEFLIDRGPDTPRSSGRFSGYPHSRNRHSLVRSNSLSEIISPTESLRDDSSLLPGDSISLRPAQVSRNWSYSARGSIQSTSVPIRHATRHGLSVTAVRSPSPSYASTGLHDGSVVSAPSASPIPPPSQVSSNAMEPMDSPDTPDRRRRQKTKDDDSLVSQATTRSLQQRRRAKRLASHTGSFDETTRDSSKRTNKTSRSTADLNSKGLPPLPPHANENTNIDQIRKERAAAVAAALSPQARHKAQETNPPKSSRAFPASHFKSGSLENYAIPEDDVLSLRSGVSVYRRHRKERVRDKRQRDLDEERSRKLDEAMRLLQKDVQKKREAQNRKSSSSGGSRTPQQLAPADQPGTPPRTPPLGLQDFGISPISILVDCAPSGLRRKPSKIYVQPHSTVGGATGSDHRPRTSNSQTVFTNGHITPISSTPSSPSKSQDNSLANQQVSQTASLPPNYPPPKPSSSHSSRSKSSRSRRLTEEEDRGMRIVALEEQKWVLEQALRVLLNHQSASGSPGLSPLLG